MRRLSLSSIKKAPKYIYEHPQFLFSLILVAVVPLAFLFTGQQFLRVASDNQERLEKDRIGLMHDVFVELVLQNSTSPGVLQEQIETIALQNPDITKFRVARETNEGILVLAALRPDVVGSYEAETELYKFSSLEPDESLIFEYFSNDVRLWQAFRSAATNTADTFFVFTETSFEQTDALFAARIKEAYWWLFGLLIVVMYLAYRHLRLIDYGYLYREAKDAISTRDLFTNMVTHELRAPLTAIRGYASMIHENKDVEFSVREQAVRIEQSSGRLLLIVNDLLEVARLQSGKLQIEKTETDICKIIKDTLHALESTAHEKAISLSSDLHQAECKIETDGKRLTQVLTNLVNNSIKYTEAGSINVVLETKATDVIIWVQDTGMGISAQDQKKLFAPFFRVQSDDVSKITGSGLGMWITKQLVSLLGGTIAVESIKDVGTHVILTLPKD